MITAAKARRLNSPASREARLDLGPQRITLSIYAGSEPSSVVDPIDVAASSASVVASNWAGDSSGSYAQAQGRALWSNVFSGKLGLTIGQAARVAEANDQCLTIRVVRDDSTPNGHWRQPWELLADPAQGGFLALAASRSIVRGVKTVGSAKPLPADRPLRVEIVCTLPRDVLSHVAAEISWLMSQRDGCEARVVNCFEREGLIDRLRSTSADVVHFITAGAGRRGLVVSPDEKIAASGGLSVREGGPQFDFLIAPSDDLVQAMPASVGLVVLSGCHVESTAEALATTGLTVLGHQGSVLDEHAAALTSAFYRPMLAGQPTDWAIAEARRSLEQSFPGQAAWSTTRLFTAWPAARFGASTTMSTTTTTETAADTPVTEDLSSEELLQLLQTTNATRLETLPPDSPYVAQQKAANYPDAST